MDGTILAWTLFMFALIGMVVTASWFRWFTYERRIERRNRKLREQRDRETDR